MKKLGVTVIKKIDSKFHQIFKDWVSAENKIQFKLTHSTEDIVTILMQNIPTNSN